MHTDIPYELFFLDPSVRNRLETFFKLPDVHLTVTVAIPNIEQAAFASFADISFRFLYSGLCFAKRTERFIEKYIPILFRNGILVSTQTIKYVVGFVLAHDLAIFVLVEIVE